MSTSPKKILILGPAWVGDMVMAQSLFKLIKKLHPKCQIDVLAPAWTEPLLSRMPEVDNSFKLPFKHKELNFWERIKFGKKFKNQGYDKAIVLPNSWKSGLVIWATRIPVRIGWLGEFRHILLNDARKLDKDKYPLMTDRFLALAKPRSEKLPEDWERPNLKVKMNDCKAALSKHELSTEMPVLALCPGAEFGPSKRWPENYYAEVAKYFEKKGYQTWIFGSKNDSEVAKNIQNLTNNKCCDLTGKTTLGEAIDLLSLARIVVTNDSGLMHISAALNKPIAAIYGSSSPKFTPPLADKVKILTHEIECAPCFQRVCPLKHHKCMINLHPQTVINALEELTGES